MARQKEFDPQEALGRARELFHAKGFAQTSMKELLTEMDLGQGSFYATFGSKHEVFRRALDQYADDVIGRILAQVRGGADPKAAIVGMLAGAAAVYAQDEEHRGCLLVNSAIERAPHDPEMAALLRRHWGRVERALTQMITAAAEQGRIDLRSEPRALARMLIAVVHGMAVRSKFDHRAAPLREITAAAAALL